ncbi:TBC1 domain family member 16 isoform X1 [Bradysia coprophila]|uniref:TBC1 domain family member 16 isoform X1 n=1 Tax=Bradysia coprophila TaxID=38358 RepID=UPI00187DB403|nr:TBC1 domain family member 16 isoform X1 [Bradysia coprophila]
MPIVNIIKKASSYILGYDESADKDDQIYEDNEVLFCKNNICVHPPAFARQESDILHYPGYLTVTTKTFVDQYNNAKRPTLMLTWIPNATLRKCPSTVENSIIHRQFSEELKQNKFLQHLNEKNALKNGSQTSLISTHSIVSNNTNPFLEPYFCNSPLPDKKVLNNENGDNFDAISVSSSSDKASVSTHSRDDAADDEDVFTVGIESQPIKEETEDEIQLKRELEPLLGGEGGVDTVPNMKLPLPFQTQQSVTSVNITIANPRIQNHDISPTESVKQQSDKFMRTLSTSSQDDNFSPNWMTPELFAYKHNLSFPDSATASPVVTRKQVPLKCRRFSVDLSQMRSLRLFFNDENCTSGQLVIASRESQYKILHFHHGGLDHLAQVLHQWHCLLHNIKLAPGTLGNDEPNLPYRQFMVCRPEVKKSELHPDEDNVNKITTDYFYGTLLNEKGQIEDDLLLRKCVFFGGLEKSLRKTVWPFLLHCYSFASSFEDRAVLLEIRKQEYEALTRRRLYSMSPEEQAQFWRTVQCVIEKDVIRTDRGNPYFAGDDNPNIEIMKNILLNYAYYNPGLSYTQGMSDLLAPVLCEVQNESETFWCFVGLMQRAIFVCTPTDNDIDKNLSYLRELIRLMVPKFHEHLEKHTDSMELLFCHRWILLCFKREFTEPVAIRMWEACWSNYLTDYFHLFLCLAIIAVYADDVIAQDLRTDEMLLHFSSLAMYMDGQVILRKARGLLHQFRQLPRIPCTLSGLCKRCGPGMWDSGHHPAIECIGHTDEEHCSLAVD